ncbi:hypothetical protein [Nonomuraea sediminis]|uniref:hypothetical protein n=1 Tax=Nonomuraea sediminis TaxID=2835864 RepID=UPI001BDC1186|nr:hypothetical protein [Nonomuraea sediminis]
MVQPPPPGQGAWPPQGGPYQHYPPPPQYPQPYYPHQRYGPPPKKPKWPWFLVIGLVLALVAAACVVLLPRLLSPRSTPTIATGEDATGKGGGELKNVPRKGYGEQSDGVADPAPLVEKESTTQVRHAGAPVIPACTLLTFADLAGKGLRLFPNPLAGPYSRAYFDNQGTGQVERGSDLFVPIRPSNSCSYGLEPKNSVSMDVFQESYTNPGAMVYSFDRYRPRPSIGGVKVLQSRSSGSDMGSYALRLGRTVVSVHTSLPEPARRKVLRIIAANLQRRTAHPIGNPALSYDSPLLPAQPASACALTRAADFRAVFNRPAAPFVEEDLATAVGRVDFSINTDIKDRQQYAYVETTCKRFTGDDSVDRYVLTANVTSYTADAAAANNLHFGKGIDIGRPVGRQVGEEAYCVTRKFARSPGTLVFRKGRFVVALTLSDPKQPEGSADPIRRCGRLTGVAGQMIGRMRG